MMVQAVEKTNYLAEFQKRKSRDAFSALRQAAMAAFGELGFPTRDHEDWKYTNVEPIAASLFQLNAPAADPIALQKLEIGNPQWHRLVFVNGVLSKELSSTENLPAGVKVESLAGAIQSDSIIVEEYLSKIADYRVDAFTALNTAFIHDGAFVFIPKNVILAKPVHLMFVSHSWEGGIVSQPRNLLVAGEGSSATIVESYVTPEDHAYFTNSVTEIVLGKNAQMDYYKDQKESVNAFHVGSCAVRQEKASRFYSTSISLGAKLSRSNLVIDLQDEGVECDLKGIYFVTGTQHVDHHLFVDHKKPRGTSRQLYKGILDGHATGAFSGKILIHKDAQKTDAEQINKNLLLSASAKVDTKPQLEIFADDVKATHGAAIGQLDEDEIFYLKSRGMGEETARALLTFGFASELVEKVKLDPIRWELDRIFWTRLQEVPGT
ncbi:MAG: Fe-S cluster assembly protein SufD [Candidatus Omnitrophica bacterium]|nr:Fe-S cluster assembly protein SufD [Candidatus Omnitrophota bacterium]